MSTQAIAGICYIKVDGQQIAVSGGVEFPLNDTTKETVVSTTGVVGYKETARNPFIKCDAILEASFPISTIKSADNMTITAECANGWVYTLQGAWLEGDPDANVIDGTTSLEFHGLKGFLQQ